MADHHNVVRGALTVGGTGNVTFASTGAKGRPLSVLPTGWQGGIRFDDPNGVDWELSMCTALGNNVFSRDTLLHSSTESKINLAVGTVGLQTAVAQQLNAFVSRATVTGTYALGQTLTATYPAGIVGTIQFTRTMAASPFTKTAISGAVASAVNSLAYTVTSADQGYTIGVDCSNQVSSTTGGAVPAAVATVKSTGVMRLFGTQNQQAAASAISNSWSSAVIKMQAPAGAIGVRVAIHNNSPAYGMEYAKVSAASTDIAACDTAANAYTPFIGGTAFNVVSGSTSDKGFVRGKFGGNSTSRRIYQSDAVLPSTGYNNQEDTVVSDVIPLVPKRATDRTNEEYYYLIRVAVYGRNGQDGISQVEGGTNKTGSNLFAAWNSTKDNAAGADAPLFCLGGANSDMVDGTLTIPGGIGNGWGPVVSVEWVYPTGVTPITIWHPGDSLIEGYRWPRLAVNRRSSAAKPLHHVNIGGSTTRTESFLGNLYLNLQNFAKPDYVLMPIISPNNYSPLSNFNIMSNAQAEYARLVELAQFLAALNIKMIWWVPVNYSPKVNPTDPNDVSTSWNYLYNNAKKYAAANGITWMDINGDSRLVWTTGTLYNASTAPTSWNGDGTHPSDPVGIEGFATIYSETLASLGL